MSSLSSDRPAITGGHTVLPVNHHPYEQLSEPGCSPGTHLQMAGSAAAPLYRLPGMRHGGVRGGVPAK
jgi:hypothetical protein